MCITTIIDTQCVALPFDIVNAGLHCDLSISKHILPLLLILGWYILVVKATYRSTGGNSIRQLTMVIIQYLRRFKRIIGRKMNR